MNIDPVTSDAFEVTESGYILTSEENPFSPGEFGFNNGVMGAISPTTFNLATIENLLSGTTYTVFSFSTVQAVDFFTSLVINETTLLSADADYLGGVWTWNGSVVITAPGAYSVTIT